MLDSLTVEQPDTAVPRRAAGPVDPIWPRENPPQRRVNGSEQIGACEAMAAPRHRMAAAARGERSHLGIGDRIRGCPSWPARWQHPFGGRGGLASTGRRSPGNDAGLW